MTFPHYVLGDYCVPPGNLHPGGKVPLPEVARGRVTGAAPQERKDLRPRQAEAASEDEQQI